MTAAEYNAAIRKLRSVDRWWADDARQAKAAALFGGNANENGVLLDYEEEELARAGQTYAFARVGTGPAGLWVACGGFQGPCSGFSSSPSVWDTAHATRAEARVYAILEVLAAIERHGEYTGQRSAAGQAGKIEKQLRALLGRPGLFDQEAP